MYNKFLLRETRLGNIKGYSWNVENPSKVLCIVHGIGEYGGRYNRVAEAFTRKGIAVLALDLRGHGESLGKRGNCAPRTDVLDDISAVLLYAKEHFPGKDIVLYGHSLGGNIVLDYRSRGEFCVDPKAYIISAPWIKLVQTVPAPAFGLIKCVSKLFPRFTLSSDIAENLLGNPASVKPYKEDPMIHNKISVLCAVEGFETGNRLRAGSCEDKFLTEKIPLLLMHGKEDQICDIEGSREFVKRITAEGAVVEYLEWEGLYHEIHNGGAESNGDEVIEKMVDWVLKV